MSARQSPVETDARRIAQRDLSIERRVRGGQTALELLGSSADGLARQAAELLLDGNIPRARRYARAHQLVAESRMRLMARHQREYDAKREIEAAVHGIKVGEDVRVTSDRAHAPAGSVHTVEDVSGSILWITVDGERRILWGREVERVPIPESGIEDFQVGEDVLTPGRGAGVVEHVDVVSGVTVRVADGETWRYEPEQLTRGVPAAVGDGLIVRGIGAQATVLDVQDVGYSVRYDDAPDVLLCPFSAVIQVLTRAVPA